MIKNLQVLLYNYNYTINVCLQRDVGLGRLTSILRRCSASFTSQRQRRLCGWHLWLFRGRRRERHTITGFGRWLIFKGWRNWTKYQIWCQR